MAAAALAPVVQEAAATAKGEAAKLSEDPVEYAGKWALKLGLLTGAGAIACYIVKSATARPQQQFQNDLNDTLGLPRATPPTPAATILNPKAPVWYVTDLGIIVGVINGLSPVDGVANLAAVVTATNAAADMAQRSNAGPGQTSSDLGTLISLLGTLANDFGGNAVTQQQVDAAKAQAASDLAALEQGGFSISNPPGPLDPLFGVYNDYLANQSIVTKGVQGPTYNWGDAKTTTTAIMIAVNAVEVDFGLPETYDVAAQPAPTSGGWNSPFGVFVQNAESFAAGYAVQGAVGGIINVVTNGALTGAISGAVTYGKDALTGATALIGNIENGLVIAGRAIVNFPRVAFDAAGYAVTWGANTIASDALVPLAVASAGLLSFGLFARWMWPRLKPRLALLANARTANFWNRWDKKHHVRRKVQDVWTQKSTEGMIHSVNAEPVFIPPVEQAPEIPVDLPPPPPPPDSAQEQVKTEPGPSVPPPPPEEPPPPPTPTSEVERQLGEGDVLEPTAEEIRAQEAARKASEPPSTQDGVVPEAPPAEDSVSGEVPAPPARDAASRRPVGGRVAATRAHAAFERLFPEDKAAAEVNERRLAQAASEGEAVDIADEKTAVVKVAEDQRRAAKAQAKAREKMGRKGRQYRGFMEGANRAQHSEEYGE